MNRRSPLSPIYWVSRKCRMKHKDTLPWLLLLFTCSQGFQVSNDKLLKTTHIRMVTLATESNQPQKHFGMTAALSVINRNSLTKEENWHIEPRPGAPGWAEHRLPRCRPHSVCLAHPRALSRTTHPFPRSTRARRAALWAQGARLAAGTQHVGSVVRACGKNPVEEMEYPS